MGQSVPTICNIHEKSICEHSVKDNVEDFGNKLDSYLELKSVFKFCIKRIINVNLHLEIFQ